MCTAAKRYEVAWECRKTHSEKLSDLYPSNNIVRVIKSRKMRLAGHVARMRKSRGALQGFGGTT